MLMGCFVGFVPTIAGLVLVTVVFADLFGMSVGVWFVSVAQPKKASWNGITMVYQPTALAVGFVPDAPEAAIPNTPISQKPNTAILIWRFFTEPAVTTASTVRTGVTATWLSSTNQL